jgi:hypothetical protein
MDVKHIKWDISVKKSEENELVKWANFLPENLVYSCM